MSDRRPFGPRVTCCAPTDALAPARGCVLALVIGFFVWAAALGALGLALAAFR